MRNDPDQLTNIADKPEYAEQIKQARELLAAWSEQTGDTIPTNPTPNRHDPPTVVDGKVVSWKKGIGGNPHAEFPGAARDASSINHPGPLRP